MFLMYGTTGPIQVVSSNTYICVCNFALPVVRCDDATAATPRRFERWRGSRERGLERELVACSGCRQGRRWARRWARRWMFSRKTVRKHVTCFPGKQPENILPFYRAKPEKTCFVFSRNTYKEKYNLFTNETVGIKINFFFLFPRKTMNETGFLFRMQADGIIFLCFLFVCVGNRLNVF